MNYFITHTLHTLGITRNYRGYRQICLAVELVLEDEDRMLAVKENIYKPIAEQLHCSVDSVSRNIKTLIIRAMDANPERLNELAGYKLTTPPSPSDFIDMLVNRVLREQYVNHR